MSDLGAIPSDYQPNWLPGFNSLRSGDAGQLPGEYHDLQVEILGVCETQCEDGGWTLEGHTRGGIGIGEHAPACSHARANRGRSWSAWVVVSPVVGVAVGRRRDRRVVGEVVEGAVGGSSGRRRRGPTSSRGACGRLHQELVRVRARLSPGASCGDARARGRARPALRPRCRRRRGGAARVPAAASSWRSAP